MLIHTQLAKILVLLDEENCSVKLVDLRTITQCVKSLNKHVIYMLPKVKSAKFLIRMLVVFLALIDPASRKPNPACMKMIMVPMITKNIELTLAPSIAIASASVTISEEASDWLKSEDKSSLLLDDSMF